MKKALITGITGQDGSYLAEFLLDKGYEVHGIVRRSSSFNTGRIDHVINNKNYSNQFYFHYGDMTDSSNINRLLEKINPDGNLVFQQLIFLQILSGMKLIHLMIFFQDFIFPYPMMPGNLI